MDTNIIIIVSTFGGVGLLLIVTVLVLCVQVSSLRRKMDHMQTTGRLRVQKLKMDNDKSHSFHNPALSPDEELSRRGYSMYMGSQDVDVESGRGTERQTGGQFVEELARELDNRQHKQSTAPRFLLQSIEENKRKSRNVNPVSNHNAGRQSDTNPNFIY